MMYISNMKYFYVSIFIFANTIFAQINAQNWSLVNMGKTYHYSCDTTSTIFSLWADSMLVNGQDTTYYLNRVILPCDTCTVSYYQNYFGSYVSLMIKNQPLFLKREINILSDGKCVMISPDTLVLNKNLSVGNNWVFDSFPNITAMVYFKNFGNVLGVPDSLMGILLNSSDTIIISKNYGIVKWPCNAGNYYRLIGVEGQNTIGYYVPDLEEIYDFHTGDVFNHYSIEWWPEHSYYNNLNIKIDSVYFSSSEKEYKIKYCVSGMLFDYFWNIYDYWGSQGIDYYSVNNFRASFPIESCRSFQDKAFGNYFSIYNLFLDNYRTVFEQLPPRYESLIMYGFPIVFEDILINTNPTIIHHIKIKEKEGLFWDDWSQFEIDKKIIVTTYILNGDTLITPNVLCTSWSDIQNDNSFNSISIFPNPSHGELNIQGVSMGMVEVYSMIGERIYFEKIEQNLLEEPIKLNIPKEVRPGMYIVKINTLINQYTCKLILQ